MYTTDFTDPEENEMYRFYKDIHQKNMTKLNLLKLARKQNKYKMGRWIKNYGKIEEDEKGNMKFEFETQQMKERKKFQRLNFSQLLEQEMVNLRLKHRMKKFNALDLIENDDFFS